MIIKPMRAANYIPAKIKFPVWAEPKVDGVRGHNPEGTLLSRTLKQFKNRYTTDFYSAPEYIGFDGEFAAEAETHPDLCRLTSQALRTVEGKPFTLWHIFDHVTEKTRKWPYRDRYFFADDRLRTLQSEGLCGHLRLISYTVCENLEELMAAHHRHMLLGYEGTCFYGPHVAHKEGKSSPTHNGVLRIKDFVDTEAEVLELEEGEENLNEAQTNELGRSYRTSHKENKIPNGMVGTLICRQLTDVFDPMDETKLLIPKGQIIRVSPGKMTHEERAFYMKHPEKIIKQIIKHKFFPHGIKDKPRFSNYQCIRMKEDL
jgi:DNA ligase-1